MMDASRDIADFKRRAEIAYAAMRRTEGEIAAFCRDDARFYLERAIQIAETAGRKAMVARLKMRREQIMGAFEKQQDCRPPTRQRTGIERWENEGGAIGADPCHG